MQVRAKVEKYVKIAEQFRKDALTDSDDSDSESSKSIQSVFSEFLCYSDIIFHYHADLHGTIKLRCSLARLSIFCYHCHSSSDLLPSWFPLMISLN